MKLFKKYIFLLAIPFTAAIPGCDPEGTDPDESYYVLSWDQNWLVEKSSDHLLIKASYIAENATGTPEVEAGVILLDGDGVQGEFFPAETYTPASAGVVFETTLDGLTPETEYNLRTYVKVGGKTHYGTTTRSVQTNADGALELPDYYLSWDQNWLVEKSSDYLIVMASYEVGDEDVAAPAEMGAILLDEDGAHAGKYLAYKSTPTDTGAVFETKIDGLNPETAYTMRIYAKSPGGEAYYSTTTREATTSANGTVDPGYKISVQSPVSANLAYNSVRLSGSWSFTSGTATVDEAGFNYWTDANTEPGRLVSSSTTSPIYYTWTANNGGLEPSTKYYVTFWVKIGETVHESQTTNFTTPQSPDMPPPTDQAQWAELPIMKEVSGVWYVTHFVNSSGQAIAKPTDRGRVRSYTVAYDANDYKTLWVAAPMHQWYDGGARRTDAWNYDPYIPQNLQPNLRSSYDAVGDGAFSRGHLVASSDRLRSTAMNTQTFYYTNMAPQHQTRFNDGIWNQLEQDVQGWGNAASDTVYVVTGLIYEGSKQTSDNNDRRLPVPSHFYKAIISSKTGRTGKKISQMSASELRCVGFLFENRAYTEGISSKFMVKVSDIESRVGFEFFPMLSESAKSVKSSYTASDWGM